MRIRRKRRGYEAIGSGGKKVNLGGGE